MLALDQCLLKIHAWEGKPMIRRKTSLRYKQALGAVSTFALTVSLSAFAMAQEAMTFNIEAQPLSEALVEFSRQSDVDVIAPSSVTRGLRSSPVAGDLPPQEALRTILGDAAIDMKVQDDGSIVLAQHVVEEESGNSPFRVAQADQSDDSVAEVNASSAAGNDTEARDEIVVTGTNIRGAAPVGAPLLQFDREAIAQTGVTTVQEFIEKLPQNFGGGVSDDSILPQNGGTFSPESGAGVNLRGLGNGSNLVLLNGNRLAASGGGSYVDVSMIPLSAVERIDVLTDGASAVYGTDAVSGVVNVILRDDFDGAETVARFGAVTDGGLRDYRVSQTLGESWRTGRALLTYDYSNRDPLFASDRAFTESAADPSVLVPGQERHSVLGSVHQDLSENVTVFLTGLYSDRSFSQAFTRGVSGTVSTVGDTQQLNVAAGVNIRLSQDWSVDLSGSYSVVDSFYSVEESLFDVTENDQRQAELFVFDVKASGIAFEAPGGPVRVALGGQYRRDDYEASNEFNAFGFSSLSVSNLDRNVYAAFGEVLFPVVGPGNERPFVKRLEFSAAGRYEDYSDFGSSFDPRIGAVFEPVDGFVLRGSWGTSFRAPILSDTDETRNGLRVTNEPNLPLLYFDYQNPTGITPIIFIGGNNSALSEETSTQWTLGFDYEPSAIPNLRTSLTYFNIDYEDRIAPPAAGSEVLNLLADPKFDPFVDRNPDIDVVNGFFADPRLLNFFGLIPEDIGAIVDNRLKNLSATEISGLDYLVSYGIDADFGQFDFQSSGSYYFEFANQFTSDSPLVDIVNTVFNPVDFTMRNSVSWSKDKLSGVLAVNYVNGYTNDRADPSAEVSEWVTVDFQAAYRTGDTPRVSWLRNLDFLLNVDNLLDEDPPLVRAGDPDFMFDPANANPIGRFVSFQISKRW